MIRRTTRELAAVISIALVCGAVSVSAPVFDLAHGLSLDLLTALRWRMWATKPQPDKSPSVVVAIDEESYQVQPLRGSPILTWTGEIGRVLDAILAGGAKVVGFDLVFPTSIEQSEIPFGDGVLGERVRGFDRSFLRSLAAASAARKAVLGEVLRGDRPIQPSPGQRIAVRGAQNIRALNVYTDPDDIVRRLPLAFTVDGVKTPSMALELASRALDASPQFDADGTVRLAGYRIPSRVGGTMTLNFQGSADEVPTFSFADLRDCATKSNTEFFRHWFKDKVVIFGTVLDAEDRRLTSKRFATSIEGGPTARCSLEGDGQRVAFVRTTIPGVYIHATAVNNLIGRNAVLELGRPATLAIASLFALLAAVAAQSLRPLTAAIAYLVGVAVLLVCASAVFNWAVALPLGEPFVAGLAAFVAMIAYRFIIADKDRRLLHKSFGFYLAPGVIERMLAANRLPELGGEMRNVSVLFSDIENFSAIAEKTAPEVLVTLVNEYLSAMTDIIERHGGYVDKYIGDSVVAVFGAPANDPDHAASAAKAALECCARLDELNRESTAFGGWKLAQRIGINSGDAVVGNFGSRRRFNYSVMSDAVNLASRLEGANKFYGTRTIASETTVALAGERFLWRELDTVRVKGRVQALTIYELLGCSQHEDPRRKMLADYADGLARWRAGDFEAAASSFARAADLDPPSAAFLKRLSRYAQNPSAGEWNPIRTLEEK